MRKTETGTNNLNIVEIVNVHKRALARINASNIILRHQKKKIFSAIEKLDVNYVKRELPKISKSLLANLLLTHKEPHVITRTIGSRSLQFCQAMVEEFLIVSSEKALVLSFSTPVESSGLTPLHQAVSTRNIDIVKWVLKYNVNVNAPASDGITALHLAGRLNNVQIVQLLLSLGSDPNCGDKNGTTPLMDAVRHYAMEAAIAMFNGGADPSIKSIQGMSAMSFAENFKCIELTRLFSGYTNDKPHTPEPQCIHS